MIAAINRALGLANIFLLLLAVFGAVALFFFTRPASYTWASESPGGGIAAVCQPTELDRPIYSLKGIAAFATEAVLEINEIDYLNWDTKLNAATDAYFTPDAASLYIDQFSRSALLAQIRSSYYSVSAQTLRGPIVSQTRDNGINRTWEVQLPVRVYYQTGARTAAGTTTDKSKTQLLTYIVQVAEQTPSAEHRRGVAIYAISTEPLTSLESLDQLRDLNL